MGKRKVIVRQSAAESIARISLFIESKGMIATAERFSDSVYDFIEMLGDEKIRYRKCSDAERASLGFKCVVYKKKYTVVFTESESEIIICELIPSKFIR